MMRRSPTRIEARLDDLQEFEAMRKEHEAKKAADKPIFNQPSWGGKTLQCEIQERIGYVPQTSTTQSRTNI